MAMPLDRPATDGIVDLIQSIRYCNFFDRIFKWKNVVDKTNKANETLVAMVKYEDDCAREAAARGTETIGLRDNLAGADAELAETKEKLLTAEAKEDLYVTTNADQKAEISRLKEAADNTVDQIVALQTELNVLKAKNTELSNANMDVAGKVAKYKESDFKNLTQATALQKDVEVWKAKYDEAKLQVTELTKRVAGSDAVYKNQLDDYNVKISELTALKRQLDEDRAELQRERESQYTAQLEAMKQTWVAHETAVEESVRGICSKYQLEYFGKEQVPFKGKPDNTIMICDEYVIFDAKSPQTDNLSNFPDYVKSQAEAAKKYAKEDEVRKDIYLVVPSNTLESLPEYYYNMGDYNVYVIGVDSLLPVILNLKKLEAYEFAEQLSPEERENICRVIGKFSHAAKRAIQLDDYMCGEFSEILSDCNSLPTDFVEKIDEFEKSEKLNPPMEKRAKSISEKEIQKCQKGLKQAGAAHGIEVGGMGVTNGIGDIKLFKE